MSATAWDCPDCNQTHPRGCHAHTLRDGDRRPCGAPAVRGLTVCTKHGGASPQSKAKAAKHRAIEAASREVARLGARLDIHPATALIDLVQWTAGEVAYWREVVVELEQAEDEDGNPGGHRALTWGVTKVKDGGDDRGTTTAAGPHVAYTMLERSSDRLAAYAAAALRAGVDERRVQLAERQGALVADAIRGVLNALDLSEAQWALVPTVVPQMLRTITGTTVPKETQPR